MLALARFAGDGAVGAEVVGEDAVAVGNMGLEAPVRGWLAASATVGVEAAVSDATAVAGADAEGGAEEATAVVVAAIEAATEAATEAAVAGTTVAP